MPEEHEHVNKNKPFNTQNNNNALIPKAEEVEKKEKKDEGSICDLLKMFSGKVIESKSQNIPKKEIIKHNEEDNENDEEDDEDDISEESDFQVEQINHYIRDKNDDEEDEDDGSQECIEELSKIVEMGINRKKEFNKNKEEKKKLIVNKKTEKKYKEQPKFEGKDKLYNKPKDNVVNPKSQNTFNKIAASNVAQQNTNHTAFLGNLPLSVDESKVKKCFKPFGKISNIRLMTTKEGQSRGFGYIDFNSNESLDKAVNNAGKILIDGKKIKIEKANASFNTQISNPEQKRLGKKKQRAQMNKEREQNYTDNKYDNY